MDHPSGNLLLDSLPAPLRSQLLAQCRRVDLPLRTSIFTPDSRPKYVHFLTSGFASIVTTMLDGSAVEVGLAGRDGFPEKLHVLGPLVGSTTCFIQVAGTGWRMSFAHFQAEFLRNPHLLKAVHQFIQHDALVLSQLGACNRLHEIESRLARWLLMVQDLLQQQEFKLSQEFIAQMLGVQRSTVSVASGALQRSGAITARHGKITFQDRILLESTACECYAVIAKLSRQLYS